MNVCIFKVTNPDNAETSLARRTKADAQATRDKLLDAAESLFQTQGVSRTSLSQIAAAAGATRGAIYWHFEDKADLFNAMMHRVTLPLEEGLACTAAKAERDEGEPLLAMRAALMEALVKTAHDARTRRVFEVATHMVEYVDEMQAVRERHLQIRSDCLRMIESALGWAARRQGQRLSTPLPVAATGLHALVDGLIHNWLLTPSFDLVATGAGTIDGYLKGLGLSLPET